MHPLNGLMFTTSNLSGVWSGVGVQRGGKRCQECSQFPVPGNPRLAEGAACLLLQPGVLQEAGGAEKCTPEEHGRAGENVHQPGQREAHRGKLWETRGKRGQTVYQVGYILSSFNKQGKGQMFGLSYQAVFFFISVLFRQLKVFLEPFSKTRYCDFPARRQIHIKIKTRLMNKINKWMNK